MCQHQDPRLLSSAFALKLPRLWNRHCHLALKLLRFRTVVPLLRKRLEPSLRPTSGGSKRMRLLQNPSCRHSARLPRRCAASQLLGALDANSSCPRQAMRQSAHWEPRLRGPSRPFNLLPHPLQTSARPPSRQSRQQLLWRELPVSMLCPVRQ